MLVLLITLGAFSMQVERMKLVDVAATAARALARGEDQAQVLQLISQLGPSSAAAKVDIEVSEQMLCVSLARTFELPGLPAKLFEIAERQCSRKVGL
ncbi:MAG: hypothetical protein RL100_59 [Actinomycetota bacterium]|jgi:hypothetical protein